MSHLLEEAAKMYEDIVKAEDGIEALKKFKEEKTNLRENKIDEFIETQIIPPARSMGYEVYGQLGFGDRLRRWADYKNRYKTPSKMAHVVLHKDGSTKIEVFIYTTDKPKVELIPLKYEELLPQRISKPEGFLTWMLDLNSPQESLKQWIKKYETEIYIPQRE